MRRTVVVGMLIGLATPPAVALAQPSPRVAEAQRVADEYAAQSRAAREAADQRGAAASSAGGTGISWLTWGIQAVNSLRDLRDSYNTLTDRDPSYDPNYTPPGAPRVPSNCQGTEGCGDCYRAAYGDLNRLRIELERIRAAYQNTKDFADKSVAFGDTVSPIHGVSGLAWQTEKTKILLAEQQLQQTYDAKIASMMPKLEAALRKIGECEQKFFNTPDWYDRYGFIYYTFMADRYKR